MVKIEVKLDFQYYEVTKKLRVGKRDFNFLPPNIYSLVAYKIPVFFVPLSVRTTNRSNYEIWISFISRIFSSIL